MRYATTFFLLLLALTSCSQADDICTDGGTPKMKVKFKKAGKLYTAPQLFVDVLIGSDTLNVSRHDTINVDSLLIPLKVNGEGFTDILVREEKTGPVSKIKISYSEISEYVSPGCGIRKIYDNLQSSLISANPITEIETNSKQVHDEIKTVLYFDF